MEGHPFFAWEAGSGGENTGLEEADLTMVPFLKEKKIYPKPHFSFLQNSLQHSPTLGEPRGPTKPQGLFSKYLNLSLYNQILILVFVFVF